jgi:hypothetical protein
MKPRKMQSRVMWAVVGDDGTIWIACRTRKSARDRKSCWDQPKDMHRVVRVRVTEAP